VSALERRCRWLLRAYPAWYRRGRGEEMLHTLLEASPPGRRWPSFRDTRALVIGGLRVRGWIWLLSVLWVMGGAAQTGYDFYVTTKPYGYVGLRFEGLSAGPVAVRIAGVLALIAGLAWLVLPLPALVGGFIRLGRRQRNWLFAVGWVGAWVAGCYLMRLATLWSDYPGGSLNYTCTQGGSSCSVSGPAVVSWGELAICAAWLVLGAVMTRILARPARRSYVPDPTSRASHEASRWPPGAGDLQT
jgi:hypothetical protein